jgi:hypothetical protein
LKFKEISSAPINNIHQISPTKVTLSEKFYSISEDSKKTRPIGILKTIMERRKQVALWPDCTCLNATEYYSNLRADDTVLIARSLNTRWARPKGEGIRRQQAVRPTQTREETRRQVFPLSSSHPLSEALDRGLRKSIQNTLLHMRITAIAIQDPSITVSNS